jgi:hypothetical protein
VAKSQRESTYIISFNEGSDARIAGRALASNPYDKKKQAASYYGFREGWLDVDSFWGVDASDPPPLPYAGGTCRDPRFRITLD